MSFENFEIEFFPVGEGSRAGDAITVRYEVAPGDYRVMVIDGGTDDAGAAVVGGTSRTYTGSIRSFLMS